MSSHSSANNRLAKNTLYLYFRSIILLLINLYTSRIILKVLGVEDFGIYNVVGGVVAMFSMLSHTMSEASQRFITFALGKDDKEHTKKVFATSCTSHILLATIVVLLIELIGVYFLYHGINIPSGRYTAAFWVMQFCIASLFVNIISVPYNALIIAHEKMDAFAYISVIEGSLKLICLFFLDIFDFDKLILYGLFQLIIGIIIRFIYVGYSKTKFEEVHNLKYKIDPPLFKEMFSFAGWNLVGSGSLLLRNQGIDILLNTFFGVTVNAAKGICNQVQNAVTMLVGNLTTSIKPQLTKSIAQEDYSRSNELILTGSRIAFFLMAVLTIPLTVSANEIFELWLVNTPPYAVDMVRIAFIYIQLNITSRFIISGLLAYGNIRNYQLSIGLLKLLTFPLAWVILIFGGNPLTGIFANIIIEVFALGGRLYLAGKRLNLSIKHFITKVFIRCWVTWGLSIICPLLLYTYCTHHVIFTTLFSIISCFTIIWFIGLNKSEKEFMINKCNLILRKK